MTLPGGANNPPISLADINAEFGLGTNLGAYRGVKWYRDDGTSGVFSTTNISIDEFHGKRASIPSGSQSYTSPGTYTFTVPLYNKMTITAKGSSGGGGGGSGAHGAGANGSPGQASTFGSYASGDYGRGGTGAPSSATVKPAKAASGMGSDGTPAGGTGGTRANTAFAGADGGDGGDGGKSVVLLDRDGVPATPAPGTTITVNVYAGGAGGAPGYTTVYVGPPVYYVNVYGTAGANGASGSVAISWV